MEFEFSPDVLFSIFSWTRGRVLNMRQDGIYETPRFYIFIQLSGENIIVIMIVISLH